MKLIICTFLALVFAPVALMAQESDNDKTETIELLYKKLKQIEQEEKTALRKKVEDINSLLNNGVVGVEEADRLKLKAAEDRAKIMEKRQATLLETIAFLEKKEEKNAKQSDDVPIFLDIDNYFKENEGVGEVEQKTLAPLQLQEPQREFETVENTEINSRTTLDLVFATGLNNAVRDGISWSDIKDETDLNFYSSRFLEFGFALKTRLTEKNGLRIKYGLSLQINELEPSDNRFYDEVDGQTVLEQFPTLLDKSSFILSNLVLPVHLELGPTKRKFNSNGDYYSTSNKFKIGLGGYVGVNMSARQRLFFRSSFRGRSFLNGRAINGYDVNRAIYGVSAYVGFGAISLYGKYDLNPVFGNGITDQRNVSVGVRLDL